MQLALTASKTEPNNATQNYSVNVKPRWDLAELQAPI